MKKLHTMMLSVLLVSAMLLGMVPAAAAADEVQWGPVHYTYERSNNSWSQYVLSASRTDLNDPDNVERAGSAYDYEMDGTKVITRKPTCTAPGSATLPNGAKFPSHCAWATSSGPITAEVPALGHSMNYTPDEILTPPTYEADGLGLWKCERCDYEEQRVLRRKVPTAPESVVADCMISCTSNDCFTNALISNVSLPIRVDGGVTLETADDLYHVKGTVDPTNAINIFNASHGDHVPVANQIFAVDAAFDPEAEVWVTSSTFTVEVNCKNKVAVNYTVKHLLQKLDAPMEYEEKETEPLSGLSGSDTAAKAKTYEGFTAQAVTQEKIAFDGSTVVEIRYDRNIHTLSFDVGLPEGTSLKLPYGAPIIAPTPIREGFLLEGWEPALPETMPDRDVTCTAQWKAGTLTTYRVRHLLQSLEDSHHYNIPYALETFSGYVGEKTKAEHKTIPGFTVHPYWQEPIQADGATFIYIVYDRNHHTLTWNLQGGTAQGKYTQGDTAFGAPIIAPTVVKDGFVFDGWDVIPAETMPDADVTYVARWTDKAHVHETVQIPGCEPTPGSDGWKPYYKCSCGRYFEDRDATKEIPDLSRWKDGDGKLPMLGYKFLEGMDTSWIKNSGKNLRFRANGELMYLGEVSLDGEALDGKAYTVSSGSTVVELKAAFLETLKPGSHTLTLCYQDGECSTAFTVKTAAPDPDETKPVKPDETKPGETKPVKPDGTKPVKPDGTKPAKPGVTPKTGDESLLLMWSLLSMASLTAMLALSRRKQKQ